MLQPDQTTSQLLTHPQAMLAERIIAENFLLYIVHKFTFQVKILVLVISITMVTRPRTFYTEKIKYNTSTK